MNGPMRGNRRTGGCSCCGGDNPPTRAAEAREWRRDAAKEYLQASIARLALRHPVPRRLYTLEEVAAEFDVDLRQKRTTSD